MAANDFFARWSKNKSSASSDADADIAPIDDTSAPQSIPSPVTDKTVAAPLPTQDDVARLTRDSDFSVFMASGVDEGVKRSAMKKLFSDPRFNIMDGLDTYIEDYTKFKAMTPAVLASLNHAKALLDPLSQLKSPLMTLLEAPEKVEVPSENALQSDEPAEPADETSDDDGDEKPYAEEQEFSVPKESASKSDVSDG